jgi:putative transposase
MPHHVTQRGNRRQQTFFGEEDYRHYLELISRFCRAEQVAIWAYCLMPNHVHLIVVPQSAESLRRAIGEVHRRYTRWINFREGWREHLLQGRFTSFVMDEDRLVAPDCGAVRGAQPRARRIGPGTKPLALEQRGGSPERA